MTADKTQGEGKKNWHEWLIRMGNPDKSITENMDDFRKHIDSFDTKKPPKSSGRIRMYKNFYYKLNSK